MARVVLVEGDVTARELLLSAFRVDAEIEIAGIASSAAEALRLVTRLKPQIVVMGLRMPHLEVYAAVREMMIHAPAPIILVAHERALDDAKLSVDALQAGALAVVPSPGSRESSARQFASTVKAMSQVKVVRRWPDRPGPEQRPISVEDGRAPRIVAIAASTGGPAALQVILSSLPANFPLPILLVQHISAGFIGDFAEWLGKAAQLTVKIARDGEILAARTAYIAPEDRHLGVRADRRILISDSPPIGGFRPSANFLFGSVAAGFGSGALAIILTGMGNDGVEGLRSVRARGGKVIAQDEASSVVFGMPRAAIEAGVVNDVLPLRDVVFTLARRTGTGDL